jgi:Flp pilus assembly protein CpaB
VESIMSSKLFTTRQGTILLGLIAALIAAVALVAYLNHYRNSAKAVPVSVLVAQKLIQKGTSGDVLRTTPGYYESANYAKSDVQAGAITDPAEIAGKVALTDIASGQQLTQADFGVASSSVSTALHPGQRAVVIPLGSPQSVGGQVTAGSHVDVWVAYGGKDRELFQDLYVMAVSGENVTFRATPQQAGTLIYASQNAQIWLVLRPTLGTHGRPAQVGAANLLRG